MATSKGVFVTLPEFLELKGDVARSSSLKRTVNTLRIQPFRVFAFWVSPTQRNPANQWTLHVASKRSNLAHFPIDHDDVEWQHAAVAADGMADLVLSNEYTYAFFLTRNAATEQELKQRHLPWPVSIETLEDRPNEIHICFPPPLVTIDPHGFQISNEFNPDTPTMNALAFGSVEHLALPTSAQLMIDAWAIHGLIQGGAMIRKSESGIDEWDIHIAQHFDWPKFPYRALLPTSNHHWHYIFPDPNLQAGLPWNSDSLREAIRNGDAVALSVGELVMLAGDFYSSFEEMENGPSRDPLNIMLGVTQGKPLAGMIFDAAKWNAGAGGFDVGSYLPSPLEKLTLPPDPSPIEALAIKGKMQWVSYRAREGKDAVEWELLKPLAELLRSIAGKTPYSEMHALAQLLPQGGADRTLDKMLPKLPWTKHTDWRAFLRGENSSPRMRTMISRLSATPVADEAFSIAVTNGRYPHLALHNNPHFSPDNWTAFERYHRRALHTVAGHMRAAPSAFRTSPIPAEAIALTAFGLHFLTDSFSAGHMRVPRAALGLSGALAAKVMHDLDGYYGLTVANGFHEKWHAYGDDHLRAESLDPEQKLILKLLEMREPSINAEAGTNARRASEAVAAAFQQLHQEAQRYWSPMSVWEVGACLERPVDYSKAVHIALALNRDDQGLLHENLAPARSALSRSLDKILAASIDEKIRVMKMHVPRCEDAGMEAYENPPPLFFKNDAGQIEVSQADIGGAGARAYTLTMALGIKRGLHLKWHPSPVIDQRTIEVDVDFTSLFYLAEYGAGAAKEGWIEADEKRIFDLCDHLRLDIADVATFL